MLRRLQILLVAQKSQLLFFDITKTPFELLKQFDYSQIHQIKHHQIPADSADNVKIQSLCIQKRRGGLVTQQAQHQYTIFASLSINYLVITNDRLEMLGIVNINLKEFEV